VSSGSIFSTTGHNTAYNSAFAFLAMQSAVLAIRQFCPSVCPSRSGVFFRVNEDTMRFSASGRQSL